MLDSHQDLEQIKVMGALKSMQQISGQQQQPAVQLVLGGQQQQVQQNDMFKKMMMKMMLKKMFNEDSSSPFGNMDSSSSDKFDMLKMLTQHMRNVSKNDRRCLTVMDFRLLKLSQIFTKILTICILNFFRNVQLMTFLSLEIVLLKN